MALLSFQEYGVIINEWLVTQPAQVQRKYPGIMAEIEGRDPNEVQHRRRQSRRAPNTDTSELQHATGIKTDFDQVSRASRALSRISADRCDQYDTWVAVGMALSELGRTGFVLWDEWSKQSAKYNPTECSAKWPTFTPGDGLTLASLDAWANEDSPLQTPTDGCRQDCPNRSRVTSHQETIRQLEQEIEQLRERNRFVTNAQAATGIKSASVRDTVVELKKELDNVPAEQRRPDAFVPIRPAYMAKMANSSPATVSRHLKRLEDNGIIERKVETVYDAEKEQFFSQTFVRPKVNLLDPSVLVVPSEHGGSRKVRCIKPDCNSTNIVDKIERICLDCNTPQGEVKFVPINEPEDLTDEAAYADAIATEEPSERAISSCVPISNVPDTKTTTGSDPIELQDEIPPAVVPPLIEETLDLVTAIRAADRYSPAEDAGRFAYKTALAWLNRRQPVKAEALLDRIIEPQARAIVAHLAGRP